MLDLKEEIFVMVRELLVLQWMNVRGTQTLRAWTHH